MIMMYIKLLALGVLTCYLVGCSVHNGGNRDLGNRIHVVVQICLSNEEVIETDGILIDPVMKGSYGSMSASFRGSTIKMQSVYESYAGPPSDLLAVVATLKSDRDRHIVFKPPEDINEFTWTNWEYPIFITTSNRIQGLILRGSPIIDRKPNTKSSVLARYRLMKFVDYLKQKKGQQLGYPIC